VTVPAPEIRPRAEWAAGLDPVGALEPEDDVRFLLVHHTASPNTGPAESVSQLRSFFQYHTTTKGWPDIAYNFLVDSGGRIWEGRAGSLAGPVRGDATGGSQGFAQLCCFIGDFMTVPPSDQAVASMTQLLAWLADRHHLDLSPDARVSFVSRGSNRWPAGTRVTTAPIAGHRDMSQTTCPGDAAYALIPGTFLAGARDLVRAARPSAAEPTTPAASTPVPTTASALASPSASKAVPEVAPSGARASGADASLGLGEAVAVAVGTGIVGGVAFIVRRRMTAGRDPDPGLEDPERHSGGS